MKIGITGATGQLGQLVVQKLKDKNPDAKLVALVRNPDKAKPLGIEAKAFDYEQPEALPKALEDIDRLVFISGSEIGKRETQHKNVINAAKQAQVKQIAYTSLLHADTSSMILAPEHLATEKMLQDSGIPHTILRNGWYTENYTAGLKQAVEQGAIIGSAGDGKISSATREDYAEAIAETIINDDHTGKTYELAGDQTFTMQDLAAEVSKQTGKNIEFVNLPEAEYAQKLQEIGLPEGMAKAFASLDYSASKNDLHDESGELARLINRPTTSLSQAVKTGLN
ncbi:MULTISPECIES: SDR family oxidoreductase [Flavobacteriaceae]|jgi:NAD(P)H dehydrogenase (quinone)|uniref:SDR family oxidoreductase n=1 Tax=Maribacter cobaltidurans TaxID=1178778 RepID=A0ABU7IZZ2_9FLAO|nr:MULTISPECIES: SDR family oxidoreductase [Flavobacteriaceae]MDC6391171.1 SDR family oxidoreductase [Maribacter sp. PR1]MEE1978562.1 SDR family oxidoreductase [Maribacter cobaltidurans]|tara:strand:+ start:2062 stop:2907 length:846 start_codon:yes stop_codon:yes gene_type:complete